MKLLSGLKEGGKELPLHDILLIFSVKGHSRIFFPSGKLVEEWCSLVKVEQRLVNHKIQLYRAGRNFLIHPSIIEKIENDRKVVLSAKFLQPLSPVWQEKFGEIRMYSHQKSFYTQQMLSCLSGPAQPAENAAHSVKQSFNCTNEFHQQHGVRYIYKQDICKDWMELFNLLSANLPSNK